jgi:hypothetical protein
MCLVSANLSLSLSIHHPQQLQTKWSQIYTIYPHFGYTNFRSTTTCKRISLLPCNKSAVARPCVLKQNKETEYTNIYTTPLLQTEYSNIYTAPLLQTEYTNIYTTPLLQTEYSNIYTTPLLQTEHSNIYTTSLLQTE